MATKKAAEESYGRTSKVVNDLIDAHDGDASLIITDIIMMITLVVRKVPNKEVAEELCDFVVTSAQYIKSEIHL